ncbi:hypothetical protein [Nocardiopsis listeri]|uniref:hypothetical protein n=1 Tax=Nocardiopsis listeri TaxID=53440 RepID=UPI00350E41D3
MANTTTVARVGARTPPARLGDVRSESLSEGRRVRTPHVGSFDDEAGVLHRMHHELVPEQGLRMVGRHHEVHP